MAWVALCTTPGTFCAYYIVAREVDFGMVVAYMISAEQRAMETVASIDISHSDVCLNTPYFLRFATPS